MKKLLLFLLLLNSSLVLSQFTIIPGSGAGTVTSAIAGSGLTISNVTINCNSSAYGTFSNGASSGMGISNGLILSTGNASNIAAPGTNLNDDYSSCLGSTSVDPQISSVIGGATIFDPCIIEFDVVPACNNINLVFVFGSDEYTNWVSAGFNDAFGFFVSGPNPLGGNYLNQNIAKLPNGTIVSIDNVNTTTNNTFFVNNNTGASANHLDGFTSVLSPSLSVIPCQTYHFKLAIADASDCFVDSGVMIDIIQCSAPLTVTTSSTPQTCTALGTATVNVSGGIGPYTYNWSDGQTTATASNLTAGTYNVSIDDAIACTPPQIFTVTVGNSIVNPVVNPIPNATYCHGDIVSSTVLSSTPAGASFSWTNTNTSIGLAASGSGNIPAFTASNIGTSPITSTVSIQPTLTGCTGPVFTYSITINPKPTVNAITAITQCANSSVSASAFSSTPAGASFTWTNSNTAIGLGANGSGNTPTFTATNGGTTSISGTVTVTATLNSCVSNPLTYTITVLPIPTVTVPANASYCPGATVPASSYTSTPAGGTFTWTNSNTTIGLAGSGSGNTPSFTAVNSGTTAVTSTISVTPTVGTCIGTATTYTITIKPNPTVVANPDISVCNGTNVSATTFTSNPTGATFTWTNSNTAIGLGANGTGNQPLFIGTNSGTAPISGNVTVTPTLAGCLGSTDVFQITVNPTPVMVVPANITQCAGNVTVPAFSSTTAGTSFAWTNSNTSIGLGASGTGSIATFLGTNSGSTQISGTISITPTANSCPGAPVNFTINLNPIPVISTITDIVDCENMNIPATNVVVSPNTATISWTNTNTGVGLAASGNGNIPSFLSTNNTLAAISGTVTVSATANGCSATPELFDITINQVPVIDPVAAITQCHNTTVNTVNFTSTTPGVTFDWTNSNTSIGLGASGTGALPSFTATNPTTTQTSATITVTPTLGTCVGSPITFTINVNPLPVPTAQNNGSLCPGDALNLTSTGLAGSTYSWTGPNGFVSGIQNPTIASVSTNNAGVYTVTVTAAGCTGTASTSLTVNPSVIPTITQAGPFCTDAAVVLLQASIPGGTWSGNGIVNPVTSQFAPSSATLGNNTITYTVNVVCALPATSTIVINPLPTVQFSAPILSGCQPFTAVFTDNSIPASSTVYWDFGDGSNSSLGGTINHTFTNTGCYDITLTSTSSAGCINSITLNNYICVNPFADANFTVGNPVHTLIDPEFEMINNSTDASSYSWDFGDGTASSIANPIHEYPSSPGTYTIMLAANNASNCPDTAYLTVVIEDQLIFHVPNSFTPDGDEFNNMFEPVFYSGFDPQSYTLLIYDRWGEVLFESHNVEQGWNGTYHDGIVKEGTYTWTIQFKDSMSDKKRTYNGHVTLLK